jgi:hypothetical protein
MKRTCAVLMLALFAALPAHADVTIKQTVSGKGMGISGKGSGTAYIKGHKMRSDMQMGDKIVSTIIDLDAQKMYSFDSKKKEADVWNMADFTAEFSKTVDTQNMKASMKPNGQTKEIAGMKATGYDVELTVPTNIGGSKDMAMIVTMSGPTWIVKGAPGTADFAAFYKAAAEKGWIFGDPRAAKGSPGQARAQTEMYRLIADSVGIPYETDHQMKMSSAGGGNPLGGLMARMGGASFQTAVQSVEVGAVADDLFMPPPGYKLKERK